MKEKRQKQPFTRSLPFCNLAKSPVRSLALLILAVFLAFSMCAGTMMVRALTKGLSSLEERLGADIMVVPYEAATKSDLENIVLQGNTGYFYMDNSLFEKIASREGIGQISAQFFLASASSGCCSIPVQIIGYDPETDFTITPWIKQSYDRPLKDMEVVVGNDLNAFVGDDLQFYGQQVHVAAKLEKTGTSLDTAVYTSEETIKALIASSIDLGMNLFQDVDPQRVVSCVLINVADGYTTEDVLNDINIHVRKVRAVQTRNMISGVSQSLGGVSHIIRVLIAAVWVLALVILFIAFTISVNARKKEFAVLRSMGASKKRLFRVILTEGAVLILSGSAVGILLALAVIVPFNRLIESALGLPFLLPGAGMMAGIAVVSLALSIVAGLFGCAVSAGRISRIDTGIILREEA